MRRTILAMSVVITVAGCGGGSGGTVNGSSSSPPAVDRASVDDAIQRTIDSAQILTHLKGGIYDEIAQYRESAADLQAAITDLTPAPSGVPESSARAASSDLSILAAAINATADCFTNEADSLGADGGNCDHAAKHMSAVAFKAGEAVGLLVTFGSVPDATVKQRLQNAIA